MRGSERRKSAEGFRKSERVRESRERESAESSGKDIAPVGECKDIAPVEEF